MKSHDEEGIWYALPGGGQEVGETIPEALRRECYEELGCRIRMGALRFVRDYISRNHEFLETDGDVHQVELMFECVLDSEPGDPAKPDSMQVGFEWLALDDLRGSRLYPRVLETALTSSETTFVMYLGDVN